VVVIHMATFLSIRPSAVQIAPPFHLGWNWIITTNDEYDHTACKFFLLMNSSMLWHNFVFLGLSKNFEVLEGPMVTRN